MASSLDPDGPDAKLVGPACSGGGSIPMN